jgi:uncharacterized repeat protein (TIGR01451 family)
LLTHAVNYASSDGSATAGLDYSGEASGTLTFAPGDTSRTFSVLIINDALYEGSENFYLVLSNPTNGASFGSPSTAMVTITDNDPAPTLQFSSASYSIGEAAGSVTITVTKAGTSLLTHAVNYATSDGSAAAGSDYTSASGTLTFAPAVISQTFSVTIVNDTIYESNESFNLTLSSPTNGIDLGSPSSAAVTINDNDLAPTLQFSTASYSVGEDAGSVSITVSKAGSSSLSHEVNYDSSNGFATAGADYIAASGTLTFTPVDITQTFSIPITNDTIYEGSENFNLALSNPTNGAMLGSTITSVVTITDNDFAPVIVLSSYTYTVNENNGAVSITANISGSRQYNATVSYTTSDGTATAGSDYTAVSGTLSFNPADTSRTFSVPISSDATYEGSENFTVSLSYPFGATLGLPNISVVTITDTPPSLQFSASSYSIGEETGSVSITVSRIGTTSLTHDVNYASSDGTATASLDYTAASGTLTFGPADTSQTFSVSIADDTVYDGSETFNLVISNPTNGAVLGSPSIAAVTITDNDPIPVIVLSSGTYPVSEAGSSVTITTTINGPRQYNATVNYATSDGSATDGADYTAASGTLTFDPADTSQTFSVTITNDAIYEGDESFNLALSNPTNGAVLGSPDIAVITITDDESAPTLQFTTAGYTVGEAAGSVTITVTKTGSSPLTHTVNYACLDGSAIAGSDFTIVTGTLSFSPIDTSQTFVIPITNDTVYEGDETFNLVLSNPTNGSILGSPDTAEVNITDNDAPPVIVFSSDAYSISESTGSVIITANISGLRQNNATVNYATSDGSATSGSDYTAASDSLTFSPSDISLTFTITIIDDPDCEGNETFNLELSNPTNGATLGSPNSAEITVYDNDAAPTLQFSDLVYSIGETDGSVSITVTKTGLTSMIHAVNYSSSDGTATAGSDYTAVSGTLLFNPTEISLTFSISIFNDTTYEGSETINLALSNPTNGASLGSPNIALVTISDTEDPHADLAISKVDDPDPVFEGATLTYTITVSNHGPSDSDNGVIVQDILPSNVYYQAAYGNGWVCSHGSGMVTCTRDMLANNTSTNITIITYANSDTAGLTLTNTAEVTGYYTDPDPGNNVVNAATLVQAAGVNDRKADLDITKSDSPDPVIIGQTLTYTITVNNAGPDTATQVVVSDMMQPGLLYLAAYGEGWTCWSYMLCRLPSLAPGMSSQITLLVLPLTPGTISNGTQVSSQISDPVPVNNAADATTSVQDISPIDPQADLSVTKIATPDPVQVGQTLSYTITVNNAGPDSAKNVIVTDTLPDKILFMAAIADGWTCEEISGVVVCKLPELAEGESSVITILLIPLEEGELSNSATVSSDTPDPDPDDNVLPDPIITPVLPPVAEEVADLSITKLGSPDPVVIGQTLTYTITVTDNGPVSATNVVVTDILPMGVTLLDASGDGWSCHVYNLSRIVLCKLPGLAIDSTSVITIQVVSTEPGNISNAVVVSSDNPDSDIDNNADVDDTLSEEIIPVADLSIEKTDSPDPVEVGQALTYTITVRNSGPDTAVNLIVTDTLPDGVEFVSAAGIGWTCELIDQIVDCVRVSLASGAAPVITIIVTAPDSIGTIINNVTVSAETGDPDLSNNTAQVETQVTEPPPEYQNYLPLILRE